MTMDINIRTSTSMTNTPSPPLPTNSIPDIPSYSPSLPSPARNVKRTFDVAFLVAPDEKLAKKQQEKLRLVATGSLLKRSPSPAQITGNQLLFSPQFSYSDLASYSARGLAAANSNSRKATGHKCLANGKPDAELVVPRFDDKNDDVPRRAYDDDRLSKGFGFKVTNTPRSAFTKVMSSKVDASPRSVSSLSPDHVTYQDSLSPAGNQNASPISQYHSEEFLAGAPSKGFNCYSTQYAGDKHIKNGNFSGSSSVSISENYRSAMASGGSGSFRNNIDNYLLKATNHYGPMALSVDKDAGKLRSNMLYPHPEAVAAAAAYSSYPFAASFPSNSAELLRPSLTNPTVAAVVSASLLPSTFAAFSLPAQNICAKCNISFRMTSDLVYHMRSHHKGDSTVADPLKRRRDQDKLKCPVCSESFRERHHLTRHMTAHQDKDGDFEEAEAGQSGGK